MAPPRPHRWRRRFRRLLVAGGVVAAVTSYRNRKLAENEARFVAGGVSTRK